MGLDNGVLVKSTKRQLTRADLPAGLLYPFEKDYGEGIEIAYWRKCWGFRNDIMNSFGWRFAAEDTCNFEISKPSDVLDFIEIIASWLDEERWENYGDSIWTYEEIHRNLLHSLVNLGMMYAYMLTNPDVYLEFYDSY